MGFTSTGTAEFGIVIINPTDKDIFVNQVSIQIIPNKGGDLVFKSGTTTSISPATGTWASANNIIFWQDLVNPIKIASLNGTEYIVTTELLQISSELTTHPINTLMVSVFSSYGQFGQGPFTTGFSELVSAVVSVYMNKTADSTTAGGELYVVDELESSKAHKFNVTIRNTADGDSNLAVLESGSYILINVPPGWTNIANGIGGTSAALTYKHPYRRFLSRSYIYWKSKSCDI